MNALPHKLAVGHYLFNLVIGILIGGAAWFLPNFFFEPRHSGFYCNDDSLKKTYIRSTVSVPALLLGLSVIPAVTIFICELIRSHRFKEYFVWKGYRINQTIANFFKYYGYNLLTFDLVLFLSVLCKYIVGRQRPYFFEVCQPLLEDPTCEKNTYVDVYECKGTNISAIKEARQSFFSGHSSQTMAIAVFLVIYLHYRLPLNRSLIVIRHFIQLIIIGVSLFVGYTRLLDHKHHLSDVAVGFFVGAIIGIAPWWYIGEERCRMLIPVGFGENYPFIDDNGTSEEKKTNVSRLEPGELRVFEK